MTAEFSNSSNQTAKILMESTQLFPGIFMAAAMVFLAVIFRVVYVFWVRPNLAYRKLVVNGFDGPKPSFPLGNIAEMMKTMEMAASLPASLTVTNNIHPVAFPFFSLWKKLHGKVFIYWLGTEPFLYVADPVFLSKMTSGVLGKTWGKPTVFKNDRNPMFGKGLVMVEGEDWVHHRNVITPAFTPANMKAMSTLMAETANKMLDRWGALVNSGKPEIDMEKEIVGTAGEIIAKTSFGISHESGWKVIEKMREMQITLFKYNRYVGVPFSRYMCPKKNLAAKRLGEEIDALFLDIINDRVRDGSGFDSGSGHQRDLLGLLLEGRRSGKTTLTSRELVDECKTFFFAGHETTALLLTWTMLLLAMHPEWQVILRQEIRDVMGDGIDGGHIDATKLAGLKKMGWVCNEVLRLYSPAPNVQRQTREDIKIDSTVIPRGTNIWVDIVSLHHDKEIWGEDVNEFKPERFENDGLYGGCKHKNMGFLPFGFGGRMCVGRNLTTMEYRIVLSLILTRFSVSLSPNYRHSPCIMLSLRPREGLPLILTPLDPSS